MGQKPKVMVCDQMAESAIEEMQKYFDVDVTIGQTPEGLAETIGSYNGIVVRSATKVREPAIDAAAKAGKDMYGEKPFAHSLREGRAACDAIERYGRVWQTGSQMRSDAPNQFACELGLISLLHTAAPATRPKPPSMAVRHPL